MVTLAGASADVDDRSAGPATEELRVLTWNVQHASPTRTVRQVEWLANHPDADIVVLTEVAGGASGERLGAALETNGYATCLPAPEQADYRVLIATRIGALTPHTEIAVAHQPHRFVAATVDLPGGPTLGIVGIYVPSRGPRAARNVAKRAFQTAAMTALSGLAFALNGTDQVIVAGDLNVVEPDHQPPLPVFGAWEYDFYRAFASAGFIDAYRLHHSSAADHSWYGRHGTGYRIDHLFSTAQHSDAIAGCRYLHEPRTARLSDHSALAATLHLEYPPSFL